MNFRSLVLAIVLWSVFTISAKAQIQSDSSATLKVYINCGWCYQDYLRTQITWVNFVQDQFVSDVDLTVTSLATGSGGSEYQLQFVGKKLLVGLRDTLKFTTNAINTDNETRDFLLRRVKLGLVRYAACSNTGDCLKIESDLVQDSLDVGIGSNPDTDPWNAWVFRVGVNANVEGQKVYQSGSFNGNVSAAQIKETHKLVLRASASYNEQRYDYSGIQQSFILRAQSANVRYVHSLSNHLSAGVFSATERSDFSNYDLYQDLSAAVEYDIYPYKEAQTRMVTLAYRAGFTYFDFQKETIYRKTIERIPSHAFNITSQITQDWGQFSSGIEVASFLNDFDKNHMSVWFNFDVRIFKGLSASGYSSFNIQHDQINIRLDGASQEEVLLQQQQLLSNYNLYCYFGLSYRFGSIYNNVVNPRFNNY